MLDAADVPAAARSWADGDRAPGLALWGRLADLGVTALAVPEKWGGLGAERGRPGDRVRGTRPSRGAGTGGGVARGRSGAALRAGRTTGARAPISRRDRCGDWLAALAAGDLIATLAVPPWLPFAADAEAAGLVLLAEAGRGLGGHGPVPGTDRWIRPARCPS